MPVPLVCTKHLFLKYPLSILHSLQLLFSAAFFIVSDYIFLNSSFLTTVFPSSFVSLDFQVQYFLPFGRFQCKEVSVLPKFSTRIRIWCIRIADLRSLILSFEYSLTQGWSLTWSGDFIECLALSVCSILLETIIVEKDWTQQDFTGCQWRGTGN